MTKGLKIILLLGFLSLTSTLEAQTASVTWTDVHQQIDGFGASNAFCVSHAGIDTCNLTDAQADLFFSSTATGGIGLSLLRAMVPDDGSCLTTCGISGTVTMTKAIARGAKVWAFSISPPASMKSNGVTVCSPGNGSLNSGAYGAFATYLTNYVKQLQGTYGINLYALSVQNEPNYCPTYDGALWSGSNIDTFIKTNLGPAFAGAGVTTKIMLPESASTAGLAGLADTTMNDGSASPFVGIVATHDYDTPLVASPVNYTNGGKNYWETEVSDFGAPDPTITSGLIYAKEIHDWLTTTNLNAWHAWWMVNNNADNEGLIQPDGTITKRFYALGNFSRFIRPGWTRIGCTANPLGGVYLSCYKEESSGKLAIVAINQNGITSINFSLTGISTSAVVPWVTSADLNLAQQPSIPVVGGAFNATLPAMSVTTFVATAVPTGSKPGAPTINGVVVH